MLMTIMNWYKLQPNKISLFYTPKFMRMEVMEKKIKNKKKETSPNTALSPFMCFAIASLLPGHIYPAHLLSACLQINSIFF
jgi:hypothetical protein